MPTLDGDRILSLSESGQLVAYLSPVPAAGEVDQVFTLHHYAWLFRHSWWKIALSVSVCTALTAFICFHMTPIYEAEARITIDQRIPSTIIGQDAVQNGGSDVDQLMNTEIQLIQSDAVLRPVAEQFHLLHPATRKGESAAAQRLDAPVSLSKLTVARIPTSLLISISYRSKDPKEAALIANAVAHSYITRGMEMRARSSMGLSAFMEKQIAELKKNMDDSAQALAGYERELGVINPDEKTNILSARLLQLNSQYTDAANERIRKETDYHAIQAGSDAALEVSPEAVTLTALDERMHAAQEKMALAKTVYGPNYAEYKRAASDLNVVTHQDEQMRAEIGKRIAVEFQEARRREGMLRESVARAKDESDKLNANSFQYEQLKREAEANKSLYNELFRKIKEASINAGFQSNSIRIADEARPPLAPIIPRKGVFIFLGFFLSGLASLAAVVLSDMLDKSLRDPEQARRLTGVEVVGTLPSVKRFANSYQRALMDANSVRTRNSKGSISSAAFYQESIATLLSSVIYAKSAKRLRSILITSAGPSEGKSSCAAHMAASYAAQGKKTLLIDADLRCPSQHSYFGLESEGGLSKAIVEGTPFKEVCQKVPGLDSLDIIVAGSCAKQGTYLVGQKVAEVISTFGKDYDLVIIDAPPMLCLAEPIQIACETDGVLLISHAGRTQQHAVADGITALRRVHANIVGLVLNHVEPSMSIRFQRYGAYDNYTSRLTAKV